MKVWAGVSAFAFVCGVVVFMVNKGAGAEVSSVVASLVAVLGLIAKSPLVSSDDVDKQ
jgi:hypothetical protein